MSMKGYLGLTGQKQGRTLRLKSIIISLSYWLVFSGLLFLVQIGLDGMDLPDNSIKEFLNTLVYGTSMLLLIHVLQAWSKFPPIFDTKWYLFHIVLSAFSYLIFESLFIELRMEPNSSFVVKSSSLGSEYLDKVLGNGFSIYIILVLIFAFVNRKTARETAPSTPVDTPIDKIRVKLANRTYYVETGDILYIQSAQNYAELLTSEGKHIVRETLGSLEERLHPSHFIRVHRSTIVNRAEMAELISSPNGHYKVKLHNGPVINIGNKYKEQVLAEFRA